ncbi:MAG: right-handed parallel beta-helix repeat-containing protein [Verrucomicrobia bacterium]|nr:right-handed parallel beta-helix repeat-containing protein [Verrucomicrobiota bacterium]
MKRCFKHFTALSVIASLTLATLDSKLVQRSGELPARQLPEALQINKAPNSPTISPKAYRRLVEIANLKHAIEQVQNLAHESKDIDAKHLLKQAAKTVEEVRFAAKAKTLTAGQVEHALSHIDQAYEKLEKKCKHKKSLCTSLLESLLSLKRELQKSTDIILAEFTSLNAALSCTERTLISSLPVTICESGAYCIAQDLCLPLTASAAITVEADNVDIDLGNHVITVDPSTAGIAASDVCNLRIHNGTIRSLSPAAAPTSVGLLLVNVTHGSYEQIVFVDTSSGATFANCSDQSFSNCQMNLTGDSPYAVGIGGQSSMGLTVDNCLFNQIAATSPNAFAVCVQACNDVAVQNCKFLNPAGNYTSIALAATTNVEISDCTIVGSNTGGQSAAISLNSATNVAIQYCELLNCSDIGLQALSYQNLVVENCAFTATSNNNLSLVQLGGNTSMEAATDAIVRNCTFSCPQAANEFDNVGLLGVQGALFENCLFDSNPSGTNMYTPANFHVADDYAGNACSGIKLLHSILRSDAANHILVDSPNVGINMNAAITIDNCLIDSALLSGVALNFANTCTVKNCDSTNNGNSGISLSGGSQGCMLLNNSCVHNQGDGIQVDATSTNNSALKNRCSNNGGNGINNEGGATNQFFENSACSNGTSPNCSGIPTALVRAPGSPPVTGGNTCCP